MADTDKLREYRVGDVPSLEGSEKLYLAEELKKVSQALNLLVQVSKALEARMAAHGI